MGEAINTHGKHLIKLRKFILTLRIPECSGKIMALARIMGVLLKRFAAENSV
jgi:hypothetical protein